MSVRIQLDQPSSQYYTNLDFVSGRVTLIFPSDATISAVNVKLQAESRTRLQGPKDFRNEKSDRKRLELEVHKLMYQVQTVFPAPELSENPSNPQYTLLAGQYVYPFKFKLPFNNSCTKNTSLLKDLKVGQLSVQFAPDTNQHVKKTLPPTLSGFPGEAEIKYYVKATVVRPKLWQENLRCQVDIKFLPIEAPRPVDRHEETFARRKQQFQKRSVAPVKKSLFKKPSGPEEEQEPPAFQVDARLPNPAILTCNETMRLRVLVSRLNDSDASVYLSMFQIELFGYTNVRAHDLKRTETGSWVLTSLANMNMPLNNSTDKSQQEWKLPPKLWDLPLPNTVAPSFDTCNISRRYELEVRVGLAHGVASGVRPELIVLPLRLPVQVWSGIAPPLQLLRAMSAQNRQHVNGGALFGRPSEPVPYDDTPVHPPSTPIQEYSPTEAQVGSYSTPNAADIPDDAPPSYEDAMAEDIAPVDGPRRDYSVPEGEQQPAFNPDSKGALGRRVSERLFSSNALKSPSARVSSSHTSPVQEEHSSWNDEEGERPKLPSRTHTSEKR